MTNAIAPFRPCSKLARRQIIPETPERFICACWKNAMYQDVKDSIVSASVAIVRAACGGLDELEEHAVESDVKRMVAEPFRKLYRSPGAFLKALSPIVNAVKSGRDFD